MRAIALGLLALAAASGCSGERSGDGPGADASGSVSRSALHTGDLDEIRRRGELRILTRPADRLPREGSPFLREKALAQALGRSLGVETRLVEVAGHDELIPALLEGRGDLVAANLTVTPARRERVRFSAPVSMVREQVIVRAGEGALAGPQDLAGRTLAVRPSSAFWERGEELRDAVPGLELAAAPESLETEAILDGVAEGRFDATLADSNLVRAELAHRDDLEVALELPEDRMIAWALRPDAVALAGAVDSFLVRRGAGPPDRALHRGDLPDIRERGVLRVLTRNNPATYFIWRGELLGFEYDLVRKLAQELDVELEVIVPPGRQDLVRWLLEGRGDLVAAGLTASPERAEADGVAYSRFYQEVHETVVGRADEPDMASVAALAGRRIAARPSSHYWRTLGRLQRQGVALERVAVADDLETEEIIDRVAAGELDLALADSHLLALETAWRDDVRGLLTLDPPVRHAWAVRPDNPKLLAAVDAFLTREYRGLFFNVTRQKYFDAARRVRGRASGHASRAGQISDWDDEVRELAAEHGFDWRLILAQMHQESRFRPDARSFAGARGLLQVLPRTARQLDVTGDLAEPSVGLEAGVRYLAWTRDRFEADLDPAERVWFALAAYNAGYGHVQDARQLARERGLDPDRWFGHVEKTIALKRKPEIHRTTRFGYCRCDEPVRYVRAIRKRWRAYVDALGGTS